MSEPIPPMPWVLRALLACVALQIVVDVGALAVGWGSGTASTRAAELGGLLLDAVLLAALVHGGDRLRALVRMGATAGLALDVVLLVQWWTYAPPGPSRAPTGALALALVAGSAFAVWALGHRDVQTWGFTRWVARRGL